MPVKILDNTTVIECATFVTGPYATALLADLGAHSGKVLRELGYSDGDIAALQNELIASVAT